MLTWWHGAFHHACLSAAGRGTGVCPHAGAGLGYPAIAMTDTEALLSLARATRGFMPDDEGARSPSTGPRAAPATGRSLEVGTYCGKSALYLGAAAREVGGVVFTVDHHHGSEENQAGWAAPRPDARGSRDRRMDTLPFFRRTIDEAGVEDVVVAVVGESSTVAAHWRTPLSLLFIDGGHGNEPAHADYQRLGAPGDAGRTAGDPRRVPDPADGGRPPYEVYLRALGSGAFMEVGAVGSLRALRRSSGVAGERVG